MTNLLHLAELLHTASRTEHLGPSGLLTWLGHERARGQNYADAVKLRLERDDRAVQLVTIHRSKGLEYPVVYCPWLWEGTTLFDDEEEFLLWHDPAQDHRVQLDVRLKGKDRNERSADPSIASARRERAAENLRLLYVGITRARHRCVVVWGAFHRFQSSPLGYLLHSPELDDRWPWDPEQIETKMKHADDTKLGNWLRQRAGDAWIVEPMRVGETPAYRADTEGPAALTCRHPVRTVDDGVRTTSFTAMSSASQARGSDGRDHDERAAVVRGAPKAAPVIALAAFPRGARAGNFVHEVLERIDFQGDAPGRREVVVERLAAHGFLPTQWADTVTQALGEALATPLVPGGPALRDVAPDRRLVELEFLLPLSGGATRSGRSATRAAMAALFARHPEGLPAGYAERLSRLSFSPLRGFLKGFVDLAFVHEGRWYVADYKTNHLGDHPEDYAPPRLAEAMGHDHYVLQYHLYTVAVVRHLRRHVPDFDYDRDFAGAAYLFIRGMAPAHGASCGVYFERPPRARIDGLSTLLSGGVP